MSQLPAYLQNRQSRGIAENLSGNLGVGSPPYISIMGNRFSLIDGAGEEIPVQTYDPRTGPFVDCIVIDALERTSKIFYNKAFDPSASQYEPPACFSDNGIGPSRNASDPQSPTCAACPMGAWGSKVSTVSGKGVKACGDIQKLAILVPGYEMPFLMRLPPNSRTNFRGYVNKFAGQQVGIEMVLTRISFEQGQLGTLQFAAVAFADEASLAQSDKLFAAKATDAMVGRTDLPRQDALPAPAQQPALSAPQQAPFVQPAAQQYIQPAQPQVQQPATQGGPAQSAYPSNAQPGQQAPFVPAAGSQQPTPSTAQQGASAAPAGQSASGEASRRPRRRNTAQAGAAQAPAQGLPGQMQMPLQDTPAGQPQQAPFMQPGAPAAQPQTPAAPAPNNFGIQPGAAPNAALADTLHGLFGGPGAR